MDDQQPGDPGLEASQKVGPSRAARKRTKTGCLTCRQRRIKCGEEKPVCNNCTKSKRECKGYAQRLVFKNPLGIPGNQNTFPVYREQIQTFDLSSKFDGDVNSRQAIADTRGPVLAPRLPGAQVIDHFQPHTSNEKREEPLETKPNLSYHSTAQTSVHETESSHIFRASESFNPNYQQGYEPTTSHRHDSSQHTHPDHFPIKIIDNNWVAQELPSTLIQPPDTYQGSRIFHSARPSYEGTIPSYLLQEQPRGYQLRQPVTSTPSPHFDHVEDDDYYDVESDEEAEDQVSLQNFNQLSLIMASANRDEQQIRSFTTYLNEPNLLATYQPTFGSSPLNNPKTARIFLHFIHSTGPSLSIFERHPIDPSTMLGAPVLMAQQGLWTYTLPLRAFEHQALLQAILAISSLHISFLQQAPIAVSLKHYQFALKRVGKAVGLPMRRKQIGTLAATLLLAYYEVMTADHTKWGSHLAGSALLIRDIDFASIARDLRAQRRNRWFQRQQGHKSNRSLADDLMFNNSASSDDPFAGLEGGVDETAVGYITGRAINYDEFGQVENEQSHQSKHLSRKDIEIFRIQCDLFWWFVKQDYIQSIISGSALFLPYAQWYRCPPRAGLGRVDAIYGSTDHLALLMGRLADFGFRDRKRKLREAKATGAEWKPDARLFKFMGRFAGQRPATQGGPPPGGPPPSAPFSTPNSQSNTGSRQGSYTSQGSSSTEPQQTPNTTPSSARGASPMYGMVPATGPRRPPPSFATGAYAGVDPYDNDDEDDEMTFEDAESEWESILAAFKFFEEALGPDFMPLPPDSVFPISSPFGPALQYRTHNIGSLWGWYYTGRILLHRLHPSMPPAMMVAAGVAAPTTVTYSQTIGKIAAGIYCPQSIYSMTNGLSPTLGSCLIEVTVPIFFAAVQYLDAAQRSWIIPVLTEISRLTGWKSSDAIARGCERAWMTAAKQGRGPPYQPPNDGDRPQPPGWSPHGAAEGPDDPLSHNSERRFVTVRKPPFISWAMGILSLEDHVY